MNSRKRKERKQIITLAVTAAVIILLIAAYFVISRLASGDSAETTAPMLPDVGQSGVFTVIDEDVSMITSLSYTYNGETVSMHISDEKWVLDGDESFPVDQEAAFNMAQSISDYGGFNQYIYDSSRVSAYGIDKPMFDITATYFDDQKCETTHTRHVLIGAQALTGSYYFYEPGDTYIYTVNDSIFQYFEYDKGMLFSIVKTPTPDPEDIVTLGVEYDDGSYLYDVSDESADIERAKAIMEALPKQNLFRFGDVAAYGVADSDLGKYGLDDPSMTVTLKYKEYRTVSTAEGSTSTQITKETEFVMLFGSRFTEEDDGVETEYVYMTDKGSGSIYKMQAYRFDRILGEASGSGRGSGGENDGSES